MDTSRTTQTSAGPVPTQLSAFPLFGDSGVPQAQNAPQYHGEEDVMAWQPFFAPGAPPSPRTAGLLAYPGLGYALLPAAPLGGPFLGANPLLSPRGMMTEGMFDAMALDMGRTTLVPRLNLDAINQHSLAAMFPHTQFAVPATPSTMPSSGRVSRLTTPSGSVPNTGNRAGPYAATSSTSTSPRAAGSAARFKPGLSPSESALIDESLTSPPNSARGKRRRSIYDDDSDREYEEDEFVGTYVPTISSARQKKKRALAENPTLQASR